MQVKLIDFSPIGGTTSPLLFSWEELDYEIGTDQNYEATESSLKSDDNLAQLSNPSGHEVCEISRSSMNENGCGEIPIDGEHMRSMRDSMDPEIGDAQDIDSREVNSEIRCNVPSAEAHFVKSDSNLRDLPEVEFRVVTEENRIQPNMPQYGIPYDMIQEGMYEDLLEKLQRNTIEQSETDV